MGSYAVTGASGLIGRALVESLRTDGHEVRRLVRPGTAQGGTGTTVPWDPEAGDIDGAGLEGLDGVVHLAGEGIGERRWTPQQKLRILESRTRGTVLLAGALATLDAPPRAFVSGSAIGFYGDRGDEVLTEESRAGTGFLAEVVTAWESSTKLAVDAGIRTAFARTGIVIAGDGGVLGKLKLLFKLGLGGKLGSGRQWMSTISLADEVRAIRFLLDHDVSGAVNCVGPEPVTNAQFTKAVGKVVRRPTFLTVPAFGPRLLLGRELADQLLFAGQRVEPTVLQREGFTFEHPSVEQQVAAALT